MGLTLSLWSLDLSRTNRWTSLVVGIAEDCSLDIIVALETLLVLCDNWWEGCYHPGEAQAGHHLGDLWAAPSSQHFSHCHRTQHQCHKLHQIPLHFLHVSREWAGWVKCIAQCPRCKLGIALNRTRSDRPISNCWFCRLIYKKICLNVFESKQRREKLVFVIL